MTYSPSFSSAAICSSLICCLTSLAFWSSSVSSTEWKEEKQKTAFSKPEHSF